MHILRALHRLVLNLLGTARNLLASLRREGMDHVVLRLEGSYPELEDRRPSLPFPLSQLALFPAEASLQDLRNALEVLARDRRVRGVVLRVGELAAGPATVQTLRAMIQDLRSRGKQVVCWLPSMGTWTAYLASACDRVLLPESAAIFAAGLRAEATFLADTLALLGVQAELEAFGEYKVSPDTFRRSSASRPHREMLEAILDSDFEEVVQGIAEGRGLAPEQVRALMDRMPLSVHEAVEVGLADGVLYEDELEQSLGEEGRPAPLATWAEVHRWLRWPVRWRSRPSIGIVSVEGTIVPGRSRRLPPVPFPLPLLERQAGSDTVCQALRAAERQRGIAAVILYVDSPGGSSLASDLIWREVRRLRERKPVVVLMGNRAASGAYYIAASANAIIAQPTTLTGSIGVWGGKFVTTGLFERLRVGREVFRRGARAALWDDTAPFTDEERQAVRRELEDGYQRFKARVADGRSMEPAQVEEIAQGRIWTGRQALRLGLVDELGGFETALERAKELAGLDPRRWYPVVTVTAPRQFRPPLAFPTEEGTLATLAHSLRALGGERVWALLPWAIRIWG